MVLCGSRTAASRLGGLLAAVAIPRQAQRRPAYSTVLACAAMTRQPWASSYSHVRV